MSTNRGHGALNLITDVAGVRVGNVHDERRATGVTVVIFDPPTPLGVVASAVILGGAPGSRDTALLEPEMTATGIDACILSGGSLFGLDAAGGVVSYLRDKGVGLRIGAANIPLAVQAITFDLLNGGDKNWGRMPPYWEMGWQAAEIARDGAFELGSVGGGYGATTVNLKGGLGSASIITPRGFTVGAIAVVNAVGSAVVGAGPHFWSAPLEMGHEFGGLGQPPHVSPDALSLAIKGGGPPSTTIGLVVTDAILTKPQAKRVAIMANDGLARAVRPAHAPMDGDTIFSAATCVKPLADPPHYDLTEIGMAAGDCLARAIARGVYEAKALPFSGAQGRLPAWKDKFSGRPV